MDQDAGDAAVETATLEQVVAKRFPAYRGTKPYVFIGYSRKDTERVFSQLLPLHEAGYRIWYDEGIEAGLEWPAAIQHALENAASCIFFVSPSFVESPHCRNEVNLTCDLRKPRLVIELEPSELKHGLQLQIGFTQRLAARDLDPEIFGRKLLAFLRENSAIGDHETPVENRAPPVPKPFFPRIWLAEFLNNIPAAIGYYLHEIPRVAINPLGSSRRHINEQKFAPFGSSKLVAYTFTNFLFLYLLSWAMYFALPISAGVVPSIKNVLIVLSFNVLGALVSSLISGILGPPFVSWLVRLAGGFSDTRSRTNFLVSINMLLVLSASLATLATMIPALLQVNGDPIVGIISVSVSAGGYAVVIYAIDRWFSSFEAAWWLRALIWVVLVLELCDRRLRHAHAAGDRQRRARSVVAGRSASPGEHGRLTATP